MMIVLQKPAQEQFSGKKHAEAMAVTWPGSQSESLPPQVCCPLCSSFKCCGVTNLLVAVSTRPWGRHCIITDIFSDVVKVESTFYQSLEAGLGPGSVTVETQQNLLVYLMDTFEVFELTFAGVSRLE